MVNVERIHVRIALVFSLEVHVVTETAIGIGAVIDLALDGNLHTAIPFIYGFALVTIVLEKTDTAVAGEGKVSDFLFKVGHAYAEVSKFIGIFAGEFVQHGSLLCIHLIFIGQHACNDLCHFETGDVSFAAEGTVRIADNDALFEQIDDCLIRPVIGCHIRKWVGCAGRNAKCKDCHGSQGDFLHF